EFPWSEFVHSSTGGRCPNGDWQLRARDTASGSRSTDLFVECTQCGAKQNLTNAFNENAADILPMCRGRHAHLRRFESGCEYQVRPLLLGASNQWFPATRSVLSIPRGVNPLEQALEECWPAVQDPEAPISSVDELRFARARDPRLARLRPFEVEEIWRAVE